jgi:DNA-binding transcriptional MerR regulator
MGEFRVFELSHLAKLAGVSLSQVKNWTNGRILTIRPSIREADGKGARNLFSEKDVLKVHIANQMNLLGFTPMGAIERVLEKFDKMYEKEGFDRITENPWLMIQNSKGSWEAFLREGRNPKLTFPLEDKGLLLSLNLSTITKRIKEGFPKKGGSNA